LWSGKCVSHKSVGVLMFYVLMFIESKITRDSNPGRLNL
jgi:hypothetical protein